MFIGRILFISFLVQEILKFHAEVDDSYLFTKNKLLYA